MRSRFLLFPAALVASFSAQAAEQEFMTLKQAQAMMFPGAKFTPHDLQVDQAMTGVLMRETGFPTMFFPEVIKAWKVSTGGWLFLEHTLARNAPITYVVAIGPDGVLKGIEILKCLPAYADVRNPKWLGRFIGKRYSKTENPVYDIPNISGQSLSVQQIATGVRRIIAAHALYLAPQG